MTREEKQKAVDALKISAPVMAMTQEEFNDYIQTINQIMDWLEQEPCENAIRKTDIVELLRRGRTYALHHPEQYKTEREADIVDTLYVNLIQAVDKLPPVTPQPKTGHWIFDEILDKHYYCSECKSMGVDYWDFCPHCGAKMVEPQERSGKE